MLFLYTTMVEYILTVIWSPTCKQPAAALLRRWVGLITSPVFTRVGAFVLLLPPTSLGFLGAPFGVLSPFCCFGCFYFMGSPMWTLVWMPGVDRGMDGPHGVDGLCAGLGWCDWGFLALSPVFLIGMGAGSERMGGCR